LRRSLHGEEGQEGEEGEEEGQEEVAANSLSLGALAQAGASSFLGLHYGEAPRDNTRQRMPIA
jgi:hypothetical protein